VPHKPVTVARSIDELWLRSLQALTGHVAHDFKGALNGVSVNLEVVRTRSERPGAPAEQVRSFAVSAVDSLGVVIRMAGALLSLGRSGRGQAEVSTVAKQLGALLEDTLRSDGAKVEIQVDGGLSAATSAPLNAVRLALAEVMFASASRKRDVALRIRPMPAPRVDVQPAPDAALSDEIEEALAGAGIIIETDGHGISIVFPGPAETPTEDA
jgi:signal transduction histidine kinase